MFDDQPEIPREAEGQTSRVSIHSQLTPLQAMNATSSDMAESDVCEACEKVNAMQEEIDFLRTLLRKKKIPIPNGPYGQKQHGQSDRLQEASKFIDDLKSKIVELEEENDELNEIAQEQTGKVDELNKKIGELREERKQFGDYTEQKLQELQNMHTRKLREYAKSHPTEHANTKVGTTAAKPSSDDQNRSSYVQPLGKKPAPLIPIMEGPVIEQSFFSRLVGSCIRKKPVVAEPTIVDKIAEPIIVDKIVEPIIVDKIAEPTIVDEIPDWKPQNKEE